MIRMAYKSDMPNLVRVKPCCTFLYFECYKTIDIWVTIEFSFFVIV